MTQQAVSSADRDDGLEEGIRPGEIVQGKYLVQRIVGIGGMCVVAAAANITLEQVFALKILRHKLAQNNEMVVRFMREARSAARLKSEHVGRVFDVSVLDTGEPFMVMEYLDGQDLGVVLGSRGALPWREAVEYVLQACEAIGEAHAAGIIHRDIKPENLFLTRRADGEPHIKVLDFGIAKAIHPSGSGPTDGMLTKDNTTFGTPAYMSPEQLREARDVDARSDIFSIGVILYELTSGRLPFEGTSTAELHASILMMEPTPLNELDPTIPPEFDTVVTKCLAKDRFERYQNVGDLAMALAPFAPSRAKQYGERVARIVNTGTSASIDIDITADISDSRPSFSSISSRHRKVMLSPVPRLTPSDPGRISRTEPLGPNDVIDSSRENAITLTARDSDQPSGKGRSKLALFGGIAAALVVIGFVATLVAFRSRPASQAVNETQQASGAPTIVQVPASSPTEVPAAQASVEPSAPVPPTSATATAKPGSTRTGPAGASSSKTSKPAATKAEDFDPYGKRK